MNPKQEAAAIHRTAKPRRRRVAHGTWVAPARVVTELVAHEWNVSEAIREVIDRKGFVTATKGTDEAARQQRLAFAGIRAAFYNARRRAARASARRRTPAAAEPLPSFEL